MTYEEWRARTSQGKFRRRSQWLRDIDTAFKTIGDVRSERNPQRLQALRDAMNKWKAIKGGQWKRSIRNYDGAVEELDGWLSVDRRAMRDAVRMAQLTTQAQNRAEFAVKAEVSQKFGPHDPTFADVEFTWDTVFGLIQRGPVIECKVRVAGTMNDSSGTNLTVIPTEERQAFRTHIQSAWNCATVEMRQGGVTKLYDLLFDLEWVDGLGTKDKYQININKLHTGTPNRDNMLNWLFGNRVACIHEFGHMIGCPDEYNTIQITGCHTTITDPAIYSGPGWTTNSIMNNPGPQGRIHDRHFNFIGFHIGRMMGAPVQVKIMDRLTRQAQLNGGTAITPRDVMMQQRRHAMRIPRTAGGGWNPRHGVRMG